MVSSVLGKMLEEATGLPSLSGSSQQYMLVHGALFLAHQDSIAEYLMALAVMVSGYSICHMYCGFQQQQQQQQHQLAKHLLVQAGSSWVAPTTQVAAAGGAQASSLILTTISGEYFISAFMLVLLLHKLYNRCVGPREVASTAAEGEACAGGGKRQIAGSQRSSKHSRVSSRRSSDSGYVGALGTCNQTASCTVASFATPSASAAATADAQCHVNVMEQQQQQQQQEMVSDLDAAAGSSTVSRAWTVAAKKLQSIFASTAGKQPQQSREPCRKSGESTCVNQQQQRSQTSLCSKPGRLALNRAFLLKLSIIRLSNAAFVAQYSWQVEHQEEQPGPWDWERLLHDPGLVGLLCATTLVANVLSCWFLQKRIGRHVSVLNTAAVSICLVSRLSLIWLLRPQGVALNSASALPAANLVPTKHVFHSFLMLAFSLLANEDPLPYFAGQLLSIALLYGAVTMHLMTFVQQPQQMGGTGRESLLIFPEYLVVSILLVIAHKWLCVGKYTFNKGGAAAADAAGQTQSRRWSPESSHTSFAASKHRLSKQDAAGGYLGGSPAGAVQAAAIVALSAGRQSRQSIRGLNVQRQVSFSPSQMSCRGVPIPGSVASMPPPLLFSRRARRFSAPIVQHSAAAAACHIEAHKAMCVQQQRHQSQQQSSRGSLDIASTRNTLRVSVDRHASGNASVQGQQGCSVSRAPWRHPFVDLRAFSRTSFELPLPADCSDACEAAALAVAAATAAAAGGHGFDGDSIEPRDAGSGVEGWQGSLEQGLIGECVPEQESILSGRAHMYTLPRPTSRSARSSYVSLAEDRRGPYLHPQISMCFQPWYELCINTNLLVFYGPLALLE